MSTYVGYTVLDNFFDNYLISFFGSMISTLGLVTPSIIVISIVAVFLNKFNLLEKLDTLAFTEKDNRNFVRFLLSGAITLEFDKQGRIIIPTYLQEFASLEKEVVIIGSLNRVEIWSNKNWNAFMKDNFNRLSEISCNLFNSN